MSYFSRIWHGAAWYPELWRDKVDEDLRLMREAGINMVRLGEFAWSSIEPRGGEYDLAWLIEVFDKCAAAQIGVVLCTPTATPPRWMTVKCPQVLRVDIDGQTLGHGSRQHVSHTSPEYRDFSRKITEKLASTFGKHPALIAWQTDNEFLCHVDGDFGPSAQAAWRQWLQQKYGSIENLNRLWGTQIWSEDYPDFAAVPMPGKTPFDNRIGTAGGSHHCSLAADWYRFVSDTVVSFQKEQVEIIRRFSTAPITHNHVQQQRVFSEDLLADLDFAATDPYTSHQDLWRVLWTMDWMRGAKKIADGSYTPYTIMETSPSHNGSRTPGHSTHPHGFLEAEALTLLGLGGNAFSYWLWRQQRSGVEMCHGSVITAWGRPSIGYADVKAVSAMLEKVGPLLLEIPVAPAQLAIHDSKNAKAQLRAEPLWGEYNAWTPAVAEYHKGLIEVGFWRDMRFEGADISAYRAVLSPMMPGLGDELLDRMSKFIEAGGTWVVGPMSGVRTLYNTVPTDAGLGRLDALAGVTSLWPFGLHSGNGNLGDMEIPLAGYCMGLEPKDEQTEVLGRFMDGPAAGAAWCVQRHVGQGRIILLTATSPLRYGRVIDHLLYDLKLPKLQATWGTTIIPREGNGKRAYLIANWDGQGGQVTLPYAGVDLFSERPYDAGNVPVDAFGKLAIRCQ